MKLTENFTLAELTVTQTGLRNVPEPLVVQRLKTFAMKILEPVRANFKRPTFVSSGYRSPLVNQAVKGSKSSQHMAGYAGDFEIPGISNYDICVWIRDNLDFDQLILENYTPGKPSSGWVHCSYRGPRWNRGQVLTWIPRRGYLQGLVP